MIANLDAWRQYLRADPTRYLLDESNPSVQFWYLVDIANRPEEARAVQNARQEVLFSKPVQEIFDEQHADGHWGRPEVLDRPLYNATVWNLALLAELGLPRDSRRARLACEFVLQNYLESNGALRALADAINAGYLLRALAYFGAGARIQTALARFLEFARDSNDTRVHAIALYALGENREPDASAIHTSLTFLLDHLPTGPITFPPFDPADELLTLRVLARHGAIRDPRARPALDRLLAKQSATARWPLQRDLNDYLATTLEYMGPESRWATLNALRVIKALVL
jgi:hypothetical protein